MLLTIVYGVLVIGAICLAALAGLELVQRLVPADSRRPHNDVAGFIYAALGVLMVVTLASVIGLVLFTRGLWSIPSPEVPA